MRKKLIEILRKPIFPHELVDPIEAVADYLLDSGVTVQQWIPVTDHLPKNDYGKHWKERPHYLVCLTNGLMRVATFGYKEYGWWIDSHNCVLSKKHYTEVTHWMPLPQLPKEG